MSESLRRAVAEFAAARPLAGTAVVGTGRVWRETALATALAELGASPEDFSDSAPWQPRADSEWFAVDENCAIGSSPAGDFAQFRGACELASIRGWRLVPTARRGAPVFDLSSAECARLYSRSDTDGAVAQAIRRLRRARPGHVVVVGYGGRGKAAISQFVGAGIPVAVCDVDPLAVLEARVAGCRVGTLRTLLSGAAGLVVAARGRGVVSMADLSEMPGSTLVLDLVGHTAAAIQATEAASGLEVVQPTVAAFEGNGADEALAVLTVLCLLELRLGRRLPAHPVPPPRFLEEWAARVLVGEEIQTLSHLQAFYRGCGEEGPFRFDGYWGNL